MSIIGLNASAFQYNYASFRFRNALHLSKLNCNQMSASQEKILILLEKADKIPEIRTSIGVLSRYARFDIYSFDNENNYEGSKPELIALYSDDIEEINKIKLRYNSNNAIWVLVSSKMNRETRIQFLHQGFINVITPEASRKTLRRILTSMSRDATSVSKSKRVLLKAESQLEQLAGDIPDVYLEMERNGLIIDASPSSFQLLGIKPNKLIGYMLTDIGVSGREQIAVLNAVSQGRRYTTELVLKNKNGIEYRCTLIADNNMRSLKPGVSFYCLIRLIEPVEEISEKTQKPTIQQPVIVVRNGIISELKGGAEVIFNSDAIQGQLWTSFYVEIPIPENAFGKTQTDSNSDLVAITDKQGVLRYFKILSANQLDIGITEYSMEDISDILNHLRIRLIQQMENEEKNRRKISDEIRDDMGALISVGKLLIERIVSSEIQQPTDENEPAQTSVFALLEKTYNRLKAISNEIYPSVILQFGIEAALKQCVEKNIGQEQFSIQWNVTPKGLRTSETTEIALFRIFEDAVRFASKVKAVEMIATIEEKGNVLAMRVNILMNNEIRNNPENQYSFIEFKKNVEVKLFALQGKLLSDIINEKMFTFDFRIPV